VTILLVVAGAIVLALLAIALALPCEGCRLRRKRLQDAYEKWRSQR